jgi:hypothetical protein
MRQIRIWNEKKNIYIWLDKVYQEDELEAARQFAKELTISGRGAVIQKVKKKMKGNYNG